MHYISLRRAFLRHLGFLEIKEGDLITGWTQFCRNFGLLDSPYCVSILEVLRTKTELHSLDLSAFCTIQEYLFKTMEVSTTIPRKVWIIWSHLLYFSFKSFKDLYSSSFIRFQRHLLDWVVSFTDLCIFYKLKRGDLISGGKEFCQKSEFFSPLFCISILIVLWTEILRHSLDSNTFHMIQEYFSQSVQISTN